ncbi:hypothetical protein CHGG_01611 [Chaetomium globosum CBS 148.51]|uniref:Aminotransferase class I/classII large domain-containing protein n=1 Tax=Chaetomium globosum (strain ATCC 6205 / CBS 148.51 / DSM 1962 / NBRC 6347 / NRRL 1970) TaxID=306901 RepID=Q2HDU3_CHAGB|nr:uncharacterized protein CHGG_01611 [Chaetomium globosum CBS 148.51]EAQ93376.1 hypothetical protein CHGG_01611 [Chaetomium globosum CBS 148.51]
MRSAIRTGAFRGLPPSAPASLHSGIKSVRSAPRRLSVPPPSAFHSKTPDHSEAAAATPKFPEAELTPPPTPQERITIADIKERRARAGRLNAPTAASCNADMFKAPANPKPNDGIATGSAQMTRFAVEHVELVGAPPYADWGVCLTVGSTGALEQALRMLCDGPGRGDTLLTEEFSFSTALETAAPLRVGVVGVGMDGEGLVPERMEEVLARWDVKARGGRAKPRVLYTVPSGQNPTGATQSVERRRAIYEVARRHDVFILEDEPYYYLQMQEPGTEAPKSVEAFLEGLIPTYLSMDVDGRVMRMDSFSKVVVPGSRMGWITASEQIVERFVRHAEVANQGPSGFSQVILHKLLDEQWGHEGYFRWLMNLRMEYTKRRDVMSAACDEFLPREVVSWKPPQAGMFQWLKVNYELHPRAASKSIMEIEEEIYNSCIAKGVLVARGSWFRAEQDVPPSGLYLRATFAAATPENMREAIRRLGEAIRESYQL